MMSLKDPEVEDLYLIAKKSCCDASIGSEQKDAIMILGEVARSGNEDAKSALQSLSREPFLHPLLREAIIAELHA